MDLRCNRSIFPFLCCIVDEASTDDEQEVIGGYSEEHFDFSEESVAYKKETDYMHIIYAQHKTSRNCYFCCTLLEENHYAQKKDKFSYLKQWRNLCEYEAFYISSSCIEQPISCTVAR